MPPGIASETAEQIDSRVREQKQAGTDFIEGFADDIREAARPSPHAASTQLLIMPPMEAFRCCMSSAGGVRMDMTRFLCPAA
jgi:hypothetical protein